MKDYAPPFSDGVFFNKALYSFQSGLQLLQSRRRRDGKAQECAGIAADCETSGVMDADIPLQQFPFQLHSVESQRGQGEPAEKGCRGPLLETEIIQVGLTYSHELYKAESKCQRFKEQGFYMPSLA